LDEVDILNISGAGNPVNGAALLFPPRGVIIPARIAVDRLFFGGMRYVS